MVVMSEKFPVAVIQAPEEPTKVEALLCRIASRQRVASDCRKQEADLSRSRNSAETDELNALSALAKQLVDDLGKQAAYELCRRLVDLTGWRPPVAVER